MKFIITENKRIKVITNWLNTYYTNLSIRDYPRWGIADYIDTENSGLKIFHYEDGQLFIVSSRLMYELNDILGVRRDELNDIFIPWMEENYGFKPSSVSYLEHHQI